MQMEMPSQEDRDVSDAAEDLLSDATERNPGPTIDVDEQTRTFGINGRATERGARKGNSGSRSTRSEKPDAQDTQAHKTDGAASIFDGLTKIENFNTSDTNRSLGQRKKSHEVSVVIKGKERSLKKKYSFLAGKGISEAELHALWSQCDADTNGRLVFGRSITFVDSLDKLPSIKSHYSSTSAEVASIWYGSTLSSAELV